MISAFVLICSSAFISVDQTECTAVVSPYLFKTEQQCYDEIEAFKEIGFFKRVSSKNPAVILDAVKWDCFNWTAEDI